MNKSNAPIVLVLSSFAEVCTRRVVDEIKRLGGVAQVVNFEEAALSTRWSANIGWSQQLDRLSITSLEDDVISGKFHSIWFRRWGYPVFPQSFSAKEIAFAFGEFTSFVSGLASVSNAHWINPLNSERIASNKIHQLKVAQALGAKIPKTLITNHAPDVHEFKKKVGDVIFKPLSGATLHHYEHSAAASAKLAKHPGLSVKQQHTFPIYTQELKSEHIAELEDIRWAPAIFQELIRKSYEIRITVIDQTIFACKLDSQVSDATSLDFRHMNITGFVPHEIIDIPKSLQEFIRNLMSKLGLRFGCFDFVVERETGDFVFLEVNPSGQWLWIEDITGAPISRTIARALLSN